MAPVGRLRPPQRESVPLSTIRYRGTMQTIGAVARADGVFSLWWGFMPYYGRCGGHTFTMFIFVDQFRQLYRKTVQS